MIKYNDEQQAIFREFERGKGNVVVQAFAGCAKTTTVVEGITFAPERNILMCAFAKVNAEELKARIKNPRAEVKTLHSAGNGIIYKRAGKVNVDDRRGRNIAEEVIRKNLGVQNPTSEAVTLVQKVAALGKNVTPFGSSRDLVKLAVDYGHEPTNDELGEGEAPWTTEKIAEAARIAMERATKFDGSIDFDDMIFLPVRMKWVQPRYDMVVVDEYQDLNPTQLMLARALCNGRMFFVGDVFQAVYEFRGASATFAKTMVAELWAKEMYLSTTFRCPRAVVREAAKLVPGYTAAPQAPEGVVRASTYDKLFHEAAPGDFVLSRKNAPLTKVCLKFLRDGKRALVRGRKFGENLVNIVKGREARTIPDFLERLGTWERNLVDGYVAQQAPEAKVEMIQDQAATLRYLAEDLAGVDELLARIIHLFNDSTPGNVVVCSSVHRAKGLEADRVFLLVDTLYPGKRQDDEEKHIHYVALTRSKNELVLVSGGVK